MPRPQPKDDIRMINMTTREIYPVDVSYSDQTSKWFKTTRRSMAKALKLLGDPKSCVFAELLSNMTYDNQIQLTMTELAEAAGVSDKTVARVINTLVKAGVVKRVRNGIIMLDPDVMRHGKNAFAGYAKQKWDKLS